VFDALADPTRRRILDRLREKPTETGRLAREFPTISRPAVSKHLRILSRAGLVSERRVGRTRVYHVTAGPLKAVEKWLSTYRQKRRRRS